MRYQSYFNTAVLLIKKYEGSTPLVHFMKQYFLQHKKHGSKDRKLISHLCYNYYRLGHALLELTIEERLKAALFLCSESAGDWQILYDDAWVSNWSTELQARIDYVHWVYPGFSVRNIFPWTDELSEGIDEDDFVASHFIQPDLFLRIRPGKEKAVVQKLKDHQIKFTQTGSCLSLPNATKVDAVLAIDEEVVVQDYNSQRVAEFLSLTTRHTPLTLWDCCAASGGKSILAYDTLPEIILTVSDIRPSIIRNLKQRFGRAGIQNYEAFILDAENSTFKIQHSKFNIILCDAPCSGSGTWGRTPEQLYFFRAVKIKEYASLQKKIIVSAMQHIGSGGFLLYITCSVFKKENEDVATFIQTHSGMELVRMDVLKGYDKKADSMFAALFRLKEKRVKGE